MPKPVLAFVLGAAFLATSTSGVAGSSSLSPAALSHARAIKAEITARYVRGPKLAVTEASPTGNVVESFMLLTPDLLGIRVVPAGDGIHYAICPVGQTCPYPARSRPAGAFAPRRQALELALRTFLETPATVVSVSLPTPDYFVLFIIERDELAAVDVAALARALGGNPSRTPAASLREIVDELTRPRLFVSLGLEPTHSGRYALGAAPVWRS